MNTDFFNLNFTYPSGPEKFRSECESYEREGACCIIRFKDENKYLYLQYLDWEKESSFLTGGLEEGETLEECVTREVKEETGFINIGKMVQVGVLNTHYFDLKKEKNRKYKLNIFEVELLDSEQVDVSEEEEKRRKLKFTTREKLLEEITLLDMKFLLMEYFNK